MARKHMVAVGAMVWAVLAVSARAEKINFIFTSDLHYGITRNFHGATADAQTVNEAMIDQMNALPQVELPNGEGKVGTVEFVAITGDITNRGAKASPAGVSWQKFQDDYLGRDNAGGHGSGGRLNLKGQDGKNIPVYMQVGNHDVNNAIGYPDVPLDTTPFVQISNRMLGTSWTVSSAEPLDFPARQMNYAVDHGGVHMMFVNMWPDRKIQAWMEEELKKAGRAAPAFVFAHVPLDPGETKLFRNPAAPTTYTTTYVGSIPFTIGAGGDYASTKAAKAELVDWLARHKQVKAYFFGHDNFREYATLTPDAADPGATVGMFRADSPMKGSASGKDEKKLSFNVFTMDTRAWTLTAREYLWNAGEGGEWGASATVSIAVGGGGVGETKRFGALPRAVIWSKVNPGLVSLGCAVGGYFVLMGLGSWVVNGSRGQAGVALGATLVMPVLALVMAVFECVVPRRSRGVISVILSMPAILAVAAWGVLFFTVFLVRVF
jgi:hypothetical protein